MRIAESRLRRMIRKLIIENEINQKNYTYKIGNNQEVKKHRELEGAQIVSVKEPSNKRLKKKTFLLVRIPSKNGDMGVILYHDKYDKYQTVKPSYLEFNANLQQNILTPKPFDDVKREFEIKTRGEELFKSISQRSLENIDDMKDESQDFSNDVKGFKVHVIKQLKDLKVYVDHDDVSEVGVEYEINGKAYTHENATGSYEGLAYAIMDNLVKLKIVDEKSNVYEEVKNFLIDLLDDKIFKRREEIYKRLEDLE